MNICFKAQAFWEWCPKHEESFLLECLRVKIDCFILNFSCQIYPATTITPGLFPPQNAGILLNFKLSLAISAANSLMFAKPLVLGWRSKGLGQQISFLWMESEISKRSEEWWIMKWWHSLSNKTGYCSGRSSRITFLLFLGPDHNPEGEEIQVHWVCIRSVRMDFWTVLWWTWTWYFWKVNN